MSSEPDVTPPALLPDLLIVGVIAALAFALAAAVDAIDLYYDYTRMHEFWELDELGLGLVVGSVALAVLAARRWLGYRRTLQQIRGFARLLPICAWCGNVRHRGSWGRIEDYLAAHPYTELTHSICETCLERIEAERPANGEDAAS